MTIRQPQHQFIAPGPVHDLRTMSTVGERGLEGTSIDGERGLSGSSIDGERALTGSGWNGSSSCSTTNPKPVLLGVDGRYTSVICGGPRAKTSRTLPVQTCAGLSEERRRDRVLAQSVVV